MNVLFAGAGSVLPLLGRVFVRILNISIAACWIVLAAALLRKLIRRAPKWAVCLLWLIVALRLVMPFSIESPLSLIPSAQTVVVTEKGAAGDAEQGSIPGISVQPGTAVVPGTQADTPQSVGVEIRSGFETLNSYVNPIIEEALGTAQTEPNAPADPGNSTDPGQSAASAVSSDPAGRWINILSIAWAGGVIVMVAYAALSYVRLRKQVRASVPKPEAGGTSAEPERVALRSRRLRVFVCDDIDTPFILGLIRPIVYLPSGLSEAEIGHVLAHEQAHLSRRDHLWKPLGFALLAVYWFNPLLWLAYILFCRDIELACDEKVIGRADEAFKAAYSKTLVSCSSRRRLVTACPLAFGEVGTKDRIKSVLNYKRPAFWIILIALILCIALAVCFLTDPKGKTLSSLKKPPTLSISCSDSTVSVDAISYTWTHKGVLGLGTSGIAVDGHSPDPNDENDKTPTLDVPARAKVFLSTDYTPESVTVYYQEIVQGRQTENQQLLPNPDGSYTLPACPDGYFSVDMEWLEDEARIGSSSYIVRISGGVSEPETVSQGQVYVWFDAIEPYKKLTISEDIYNSAKNTKVTIPESGNVFYFETKQLSDNKYEAIYGHSGCLVVQGIEGDLQIVNAFFCDLNDDGYPELCVTCISDSANRYSRVRIRDFKNGKYYELSMPGMVDFRLAERDGWLILMTRDHDELSSVGSDSLLTIKDDELVMSPLKTGEARAAVQLLTSMTINGYNYKRDYSHNLSELPEGYKYGGVLSAEEAGNTGLDGHVYYTWAPNLIYVYMQTTDRVDAIGDSSTYEMRTGWSYVPWFAEDPSGQSGSYLLVLDAAMSLPLGGLLQRKDLSWSDLKNCRSLPEGSGIYRRTYAVVDEPFYLIVEGMPQGDITSAQLLYIPTGEKVDILKEDGKAFVDQYRSDLGWRRLSEERFSSPQLFGLDIREGLTVCVTASSLDDSIRNKTDNIICTLLPGMDIAEAPLEFESNVVTWAKLSVVETVLDYYGLPDDKVTIRLYYDQRASDSMVSRKTVNERLSKLFKGRYTVGSELKMAKTEQRMLHIFVSPSVSDKYSCSYRISEANTMPLEPSVSARTYSLRTIKPLIKSSQFSDEQIMLHYYRYPSSVFAMDEAAFVRDICSDFDYKYPIEENGVVHYWKDYSDIEIPLDVQPEQGVVYVWFDVIDPVTGGFAPNEAYEAIKGVWMSWPGAWGSMKLDMGGAMIEMLGGCIGTCYSGSGRIANVYFCDLNGDDSPELCMTCFFSTDSTETSVHIIDIANGKSYELSDRGKRNFSLTERNGWLVLRTRSSDQASSVGSDLLLMIKDGKLAGVQPSAEQKRTPEHITALESESPALDKGFAGESIEVLLGSKPDMTGRVMHVFVTSFGPNEYNCIIYMNARYAALPQVPVNAKSYSVGEVKQLITNWGLSDKQVVLHNYQHPMSSYIDEMGEEHLKAISAQFDDKYPVVDNGETHYYKYLNSIEHALD